MAFDSWEGGTQPLPTSATRSNFHALLLPLELTTPDMACDFLP